MTTSASAPDETSSGSCDESEKDPAEHCCQCGDTSESGDGMGTSATTDGDGEGLTAKNRAPQYLGRPRLDASEERESSWTLEVSDPDGDTLRVLLVDEPPGATWDEPTRTLNFRPDFTQGGTSYVASLYLDDGELRVRVPIVIRVHDTIAPAPPEVTLLTQDSVARHYRLRLWTDAFLDPPFLAGRAVDAILTVPTTANEEHVLPLRVVLHGLGASPSVAASSTELRLAPSDPDNSYWWGIASAASGDGRPYGVVAPTTARRVLHLVDFVLRDFVGVDPDRVYISGSSMGGAGALIIGLLWARHFAWVDMQLGQSIAVNHRPSRVAQLSTLWGAPADRLVDELGIPVWERLDMTRALDSSFEARQQFIRTVHGKDDPTIHFSAAVGQSALTGMSFYSALEDLAVGHQCIWDERGHGGSDPLLESQWWDEGWSLVLDDETFIRRGQALIAFSHDEHNDDPGHGRGNGLVSWSESSGYAGDPLIAGDTGWDGDLAGALNRHLRWDATTMVDDLDTFEVTLRRLSGPGSASSGPGYPSTKMLPNGPLPALTDVSIRRAQAFRCRPFEEVLWTFGGGERGVAAANERGELTISGLRIGAEPLRLEVRRTGVSQRPIR